MVDSASVTASPVAGPRGFDGVNKVDGITRHILVDTTGVLVAAAVTPADVQHRAALSNTAATGPTHRTNHHPRLGGQGLHRIRCR